MILEALVRHYESLAIEGDIPQRGWSRAKVSFALEINEAGDLVGVLPLKTLEKRGKKEVEISKEMTVPEQIIRSVGIASQFLCDKSSYLLGIDQSGKADRVKKCYECCAKFHQAILINYTSITAQAIKNFFAKWDPQMGADNVVLKPYLEELMAASNLVFWVGNNYAHEDKDVRQAWNAYQRENGNGAQQQCLVTGKIAAIARLHPSIKGVKGAQSSGALLVSFNARAYDSYGKDEGQGVNAPVSEYAAFAYGAVLNKLLGDKKHVKFLGDTTVVYWAEKNTTVYQDFMCGFAFSDTNIMDNATLDGLFKKIQNDEEINFEGVQLDCQNKFYVLGLAPNAARLSVRFFLQSSFGEIIKNVAAHMGRLEIVKPSFEQWNHIPLWGLLQETVNRNARDKAASPLMAGAVMKAILTDTAYPVSLFQNIMLRIRAEQDNSDKKLYKINYRRVAILKAYLMKNNGRQITVGLNEDVNEKAYVLGRLFAVLEHIQQVANPGINATIKDRYFDSACATPAYVFPVLQKLANHHLRKLEIQQKIYFNKQIAELIGKIEMAEEPIPKYLSLEKQSVFILGYYHQTQKRYEKKEVK